MWQIVDRMLYGLVVAGTLFLIGMTIMLVISLANHSTERLIYLGAGIVVGFVVLYIIGTVVERFLHG
jgi:hypothetical protein